MDTNTLIGIWRDNMVSELSKMLSGSSTQTPVDKFLGIYIKSVESVQSSDDMARVGFSVNIGIEAMKAFLDGVNEMQENHDTEYDGRSVENIARDMGLTGVRGAGGRMLYFKNVWK